MDGLPPDGQNNFRFSEVVSSPKIKNISLFQKAKSGLYRMHPVPTRGALAIVTTWDGDAVDAEAATGERG